MTRAAGKPSPRGGASDPHGAPEPLAKASSQWPALRRAALSGTAGDIVKAISPYTEADPVALLVHLLTGFGSMIGSRPHFRVEHTRHPLRLFIALVGETAKARKGLAWSTPRRLLTAEDPKWAKNCVVQGGLSSGEGLLHALRDRVVAQAPVRTEGRIKGYQRLVSDHGVSDKRLLLIEEEFSQTLRTMSREGNILSAILRQAWDTGNLRPLTKTNPLKVTGAHVAIIAHVTQADLVRYLTQTDMANGFANRFVWLLVRRSKFIPNPIGVPAAALRPLIAKLTKAVKFSRSVKELKRSRKAEHLWAEAYRELSEGRPGLLGALLARGEAQVMRIAGLYALLGCSHNIQRRHLKAALALWDYSQVSVQRIFSGRTGNNLADRILAALRTRNSLDETAIHDLLGRHKSQFDIREALSLLERSSVATSRRKATKGRSRTVWKAT